MDIFKIKAFLLAIELGSLSKAAEQLTYTPSALSHMMDSLEEEIGVKLSIRTSQGIKWTEEGLQLKPKLTKLIELEEEIISEAIMLDRKNSMVLRVGTYDSMAQYILPNILKNLNEKHSNFKVSIIVDNKPTKLLEKGEIDIAFADKNESSSFEFIKLIEEPYYLLAPTNIFIGKKSVCKEDIYSCTYIKRRDSRLTKYFDGATFANVVEFNSEADTSLFPLIEKGLAVAVVPAMVAKKTPKGIHKLALEPKLYRELGLFYKENAKKIEVVRAFIKACLEFQM